MAKKLSESTLRKPESFLWLIKFFDFLINFLKSTSVHTDEPNYI